MAPLKYKGDLGRLEEELNNRLKNLEMITGYPIYDLKYLRKVGPPINSTITPSRGSEVFITNLPWDVFEDEIYAIFSKAGTIYDIRLMIRPSGLAGRGFAFIRYHNPEIAKNAVQMFNNKSIRPNRRMAVQKSKENNRLFINNIPLNKTKLEIWDELLNNGVQAISDVITYKSYNDQNVNRGFVFVEFFTHEDAATTRRRFCKAKQLFLWQKPVIVDWSKPMTEVDPNVMKNVCRLFLRNLDMEISKDALQTILEGILDMDWVEKVYKKKNYGFVHFINRKKAEIGMNKIRTYFHGTDVEVLWSIPPPTDSKEIDEDFSTTLVRMQEVNLQLQVTTEGVQGSQHSIISQQESHKSYIQQEMQQNIKSFDEKSLVSRSQWSITDGTYNYSSNYIGINWRSLMAKDTNELPGPDFKNADPMNFPISVWDNSFFEEKSDELPLPLHICELGREKFSGNDIKF